MSEETHQCERGICRAGNDAEITSQHQQMNLFLSRLNDPQRRWYVGMLSQQPGNPSDRELSKITGLDEKTIRRGRRELAAELSAVPSELQRHVGGGGPAAETPTFAVDNLVRWCQTELPERFANATQLLIEADGRGSNAYRLRVWKRDQKTKIADAFGHRSG